MRLRVGGKAYNLLRLAALGFPVPSGFVLPTTMCQKWIDTQKPSVPEFKSAYAGTIERLERASGLRFGDFRRPLLVSVRSGAPVSMPGMLDTILNVGLTRSTIGGFISLTGNPRLAWDCYRRLIESYAQSVHGSGLEPFEEAVEGVLSAAKAHTVAEIDTIMLRELAQRAERVFFEVTGNHFPNDPYAQLLNAVDAAFRSWNSQRAKSYRHINAVDDLMGTAVTVQCMVFGNAGADSGAGVGSTRDPATGEKSLYVDFAFDAQGEDVVSGTKHVSRDGEIGKVLPEIASALADTAIRLERTFGYVQDFEFTVAEAKLYLLQTRDAKCSDWARLKIAVDLVDEGIMTPEEACQRLEGLDPNKLVRSHVVAAAKPVGRGIPAGIGVATGVLAFSVESAKAAAAQGQNIILARNDISTRDIVGIRIAQGILAARGGRTSHAAVVARELGKVAIVGCSDLHIAADQSSCTIGESPFDTGSEVTLDGESGLVYGGSLEVACERPEASIAKWHSWKSRLSSSAGRRETPRLFERGSQAVKTS